MPRAPLKLFLLGFLTLFLELALIRYLAGSVWNLGYFPNLVLLAVFVGMGVGFVFHPWVPEARSAILYRGAAFVLAALIVFVGVARPGVPGFGDNWAGDIGGELYFTSTPPSAALGLGLFAVWFVVVVALFALIAQRTAKVFRELPPLRAYTFDIAGSLSGIAAFMAASALELPAFAWFAAAIPLFLAADDGPWRTRWIPAAPVALAAILAQHQDTRMLAHPEYAGAFDVAWSPYQKIEYVDPPKPPRHRIFANGIIHQVMLPPDQIAQLFYQEPHDRRKRAGRPPYRSVLVIGAGSGNDVASALANGAAHVDAVEIDPAIARLGRLHHPAKPYSDPRVTLVVDDARAFMTRTTRRYDLVIYALTDSLVKVSSMAQLRLENYLFTEDSIRRAWSLLEEGGDITLYNHYRRPWLVEKFQAMIHAATGRHALVIKEVEPDFRMLLVGRSIEAPPPAFPSGPPVIPTDDWPFPYLKERGIPSMYLWALAGLGAALVGLAALLQRLSPEGTPLPTKLAFVFMGVAFLLLETKSIVQFSLLFGTTWLNSSLVFLAILSLVLAANWTAAALRGRWVLPAAFALLLASCLSTLAFPLSGLLAVESTALRFVLASLMTFSAIYFANVIFSVAFRDQETPERLFGWNLLGATAGGLVEYSSMALGYNALAVIVAVCYAGVFVLLTVRPFNRSTAQPLDRPTA